MNSRTARNILLTLALAAASAQASSTGLAWEAPLKQISQSASGPIMYAFGLIVIVGVAIVYAVHGELTEVLKQVSTKTLILGLGFAAVAVIATLYGVSGALV